VSAASEPEARYAGAVSWWASSNATVAKVRGFRKGQLWGSTIDSVGKILGPGAATAPIATLRPPYRRPQRVGPSRPHSIAQAASGTTFLLSATARVTRPCSSIQLPIFCASG